MSSARSVAEPLDGVRDALSRVRDGDLDVGLVVDDGGEIGEVQSGFNRMVDGLRERRQIRDLFGAARGPPGRHPGAGAGLGAEGRAGRRQRGVRRPGRDRPPWPRSCRPTTLSGTLNDFFDVVVRAVDGQGGWVNKFEGDGALCIFGVPGTQPRPRGPGAAGGPVAVGGARGPGRVPPGPDRRHRRVVGPGGGR